MTNASPRSHILFGVAAAIVLSTLSILVLVLVTDGFGPWSGRYRTAASCTTPNLTGTVVDVTLVNVGGPMMRNHTMTNGRDMAGGMMRISTDRAAVRHGRVSLLAINGGNINHELVVLPLPGAQIVGTRRIGPDAEIAESNSLGEASRTCREGSGAGIAPGGTSWVTLTLPTGRYELVCNLPGHYAAGMYAQVTVT